MRLQFQKSHLSIHSFPEIDLPDFCLITGPNGAGKSHFLQSLEEGSIRSDAAPNQAVTNRTDVRLFDWNSLIPQDTGTFTTEILRHEKVETFNLFNNQRTAPHVIEPFRNVVRGFDLPDNYVRDPLLASLLSLSELAPIVRANQPQVVFENLQQQADQSEKTLLNQIPEPHRSRIRVIAQAAGKRILSLNQSDFFASGVTSWGEVNIFQQSFARLFVAYRDSYLANQLGQFLAAKGETSVSFVSDAEFLQTNGPPPWEFVNHSLAAAGLDFAINHPQLNENTPFQPELTKISNGAKIAFNGLSSGEKVLMSFAFCVYYSNDRRQLALHPKVILLDEVDAPLHPSMSKNLIDTIRSTLVGQYGIKVIATTHSPSTVAMAPEESVYVMKPGVPGLHKTSRAEALNILTVGVPTLAISFEGRRQIFVESPSDATNYDAVYKLLKPRLGSERSLEFVATGTRSRVGAERNTGCDIVKKIVLDLSAAGNQSVFGLIDWDKGKNQGAQRIIVLAEGKRDGLENIVLDPLAISLLICRDFPAQKAVVGINDDRNFISFAQLDLSEVQSVVIRIGELVFGSSAAETVSVEYIGGLRLKVDRRFLFTDDHALEEMLVKAFPFLQSIQKQQAGRLMKHIIATVFADVPDAIPIDLRDTLADILERPSH